MKITHQHNYNLVLSERELKQLACILGHLCFDEIEDIIHDHNIDASMYAQVPEFKVIDFENLMKIYDFYVNSICNQ